MLNGSTVPHTPSHLRRRGPKGRARPRATSTHLNHTFAEVFVRSPRLRRTSPDIDRTFTAAVRRVAHDHDGGCRSRSHLRRTPSQGRPRRPWTSHHVHRASSYLMTWSPQARSRSPDIHRTFAASVHRFLRGHDRHRPMSLVASPLPFAEWPEASMDITSSQSRFVIRDRVIVAVSIEVTPCPSHLRCSCSQVCPKPR
jgi:hypothetical protein